MHTDREAFVELKCKYVHGHGVIHTLPSEKVLSSIVQVMASKH